MSLLGALFGGTLGFMLGGPIGAILGGTLGGSIGASPMGSTGPGRGSAAELQTAFMVALISLAAKTAKADGRVTQDEVDTLDRFLRSQGMDREDRQRAGQIFNQARDSDIDAGRFARQIQSLAGANRELLLHLVTILLQVALADGRIDPAEEQLIARVAAEMGLSRGEFETCRARFQATGRATPADPDAPSPHQVLGVPPDADLDQVKSAYRKLAKEYHPDRIQAKGLPEDFLTFAKEKFQAINNAYDRIKRERGA